VSKLTTAFTKILRKLVPASKYDVVKRHDTVLKRHDLIQQKLEYLEARLDSVDARLSTVDTRPGPVNTGPSTVEARLRSVDTWLKMANARLHSADKRLDMVAKELRASVMSSRSVTALHQKEILSVVRLLEPRKAVGYEKIRVGSAGDGGYVQLNDYSGISAAISFGIFNDDNWDLAVARMGVPVYQFDHTIEKAPSTHPLLRFERKKAAGNPSVDAVTIADLVAAHSKLSAPDVILKMDIEGSEWDVLDNSSSESLSKLSQIICEFHGLGRLYEAPFHARALRVFHKLAQQFAVIHVHANNGGDMCNLANIAVPSTLEITFASRARYSFVESDERFPTPLDAPNRPDHAEIRLGLFKF
jgi:hypothetical protein